MEEADGDFEDQNDCSFHRNEAISAVTDEGFMVEDEEDDYEDLYNDVNVSESFLQTVNQHQEELGFKNDVEEHKIKVERVDEEEVAVGVKDDKVSVNVNVNVNVNAKVEPTYDDDDDDNDDDLGVRKSEPRGVDPPPGLGLDVKPGVKVELENQNHGMELGPVGNNDGYSRPVYNNGGGYNGGGTMLFVGELHWWTTDAEVEAEVCKYGNVKEVRFHDEKASGKSKGYCQVEFYDPAAAAACKEGMNGHLFNGKPCVVQFATPFSIRRMGDAQVNKTQAVAQSNFNGPPPRRGMSDGGGRGGGNNMSMGGNYQENGNRGYGRSNYGRGNGMGRGQGPMRGRGGMNGGRGMMGNGAGNGFGPNPQMMHPQAMMGQGFDPSYGPRMTGYGGFSPAPGHQYPGMMSSFPPGGVGMPGVAPHVNPAFFGRGMPANGMGMMPATGMDGMGMWPDPGTSGWGGEDLAGRVAESSYGEDATSEHQYGDGSHERGRPNATKEKDRPSEREWSGASNRKFRDDRDPESERDIPREKEVHDYEWSERRPHDDRPLSRDREKPRERDRDREREYERDLHKDRDRYREDRERDRDRYREDKEKHVDHHHRYKERGPEYEDVDHYRYKDYGPEYDDEWDRGRSSRAYSKSRLPHEDDHRSRSRDVEYSKRDVEYSKRRRLPSE